MPEQISGALDLLNSENKVTIRLNGNQGSIEVFDDAGKRLFHFDRSVAAVWVGGTGDEGDVIVRDAGNNERIKLDGGEGDIWVKDASGRTWLYFDSTYAGLWVGGTGNEGDVIVRDADNKETIKLDGGLGDIILTNADIAEDFDVADRNAARAGTVMVVGDDGRLMPCTEAYDPRVVGVVSCAGRYRPGMVLDRQETVDGYRVPISVVGKVACRTSSVNGAIRIGDILTTSPERGCAMRSVDRRRSPGAIIGKALTPVDGSGLVEMIVSLQ